MGWLATERSRRSSWWVTCSPGLLPLGWPLLVLVLKCGRRVEAARPDTDLWPQDFERDEERSANGGSESDGEENIGWSTVNLDEEKQHQDVSADGAHGPHPP